MSGIEKTIAGILQARLFGDINTTPLQNRVDCSEYAAQIHQAYKKAGWVELDPDQSRPENPYSNVTGTAMDDADFGKALSMMPLTTENRRIGYSRCQQEMRDFMRVRVPEEVHPACGEA